MPNENMYRAVCHTKCYWLETLWKPGDVYEGEFVPNKHFSEDGKIEPNLPPPDHGADRRSTKEIREILETVYDSHYPTDTKRKVLWRALNEFETATDRDFATSVPFVAKCGFIAKNRAGLAAHERQCDECNQSEE